MSHNIAQCLTSVNCDVFLGLFSNCSVVIASPDLSGRGNLIAKLELAIVGLRNLA
jgi:hypothetical protein